ncbi:DNA binding protein [Chifec microvirus UA13_14]|nr:DNA binding protein [Chifec microvirus UA13_14]
MKRFGVNKGHSASKFKHNVSRTKAANLPRQVMRGGWRL